MNEIYEYAIDWLMVTYGIDRNTAIKAQRRIDSSDVTDEQAIRLARMP